MPKKVVEEVNDANLEIDMDRAKGDKSKLRHR